MRGFGCALFIFLVKREDKMMKRINRMLFLLLASILLSVFLIGCSGTGDGETEAETKAETATQAPATEKGTETDIETTTETTATESVPPLKRRPRSKR